MDIETLHTIRLHEINKTLDILAGYTQSGRLLEIGAGTGFQSKLFSEHGYSVEAVDLENSDYSADLVYPVTFYDGETLPFENDSFDILFSSNVLEHIVQLESFQTEMARVLKRDGVAIHILPSGSWRFWTTLFHPFLEPVRILGERRRKRLSTSQVQAKNNESSTPNDPTSPSNRHSIFRVLRLFLVALTPRRHGERGNLWTELYWFSKLQWKSFFDTSGWTVDGYHTSGIFYEGSLVIASLLSTKLSIALSSVLGSSTHIFVLRPPSNHHPTTEKTD